jgi:hypothetical protein
MVDIMLIIIAEAVLGEVMVAILQIMVIGIRYKKV